MPAPSTLVADQPYVSEREARDDGVAVLAAMANSATGAPDARQLDELDAVDVVHSERPGVLPRHVAAAAACAAAVCFVEDEDVWGRHSGVAAEGAQLIVQPQAALHVVGAENYFFLRGRGLAREIRPLDAAIEVGGATALRAEPVSARIGLLLFARETLATKSLICPHERYHTLCWGSHGWSCRCPDPCIKGVLRVASRCGVGFLRFLEAWLVHILRVI